MITTSIDEGRFSHRVGTSRGFCGFLGFFSKKFILSLKLILKNFFNLIFEKIRDSASFVN